MSDSPAEAAAETGSPAVRFLPRTELQTLLDELRRRGYTIIGPTLAQQAIVYDEIARVDQLPQGWTDVQGPGTYRLERRNDEAWFGYVVGPHSWKRFLFPPLFTVASAERTERGWKFQTPEDEPPAYAFLGVRACELAAMAVQDRVLRDGPYQDPAYARRRSAALLIAVNCTQAASTCFCTSMQTGPQCTAGFDLALTELPDGFEVEIGSDRGAGVLAACATSAVADEQRRAAAALRQRAAEQQTRPFDARDVPELLQRRLTHPQWEDVGARCLSCTNCTMVCPTCFCCSVDDVEDLVTGAVERQRRWDSCFNPEFSVMNGTQVRHDTPSRYRQWLTHKLSTWHDQFGTSGCVGCGRCITWCPVGIDLRAEVDAMRESAP